MKDFDEQVWKLVTELAQEERHFNGVQHHYRILASTWLLALFGGIGFVLSTKDLSVPPGLIVWLLGLAGAIGITQLWNLDIRVYHQLLDSCFVQGLKLEQEHLWLPQVRSSMLLTQSNGVSLSVNVTTPSPKGVLSRVVWFYVVGNTAALLASLAGMAVFLQQQALSISPIMIHISIVVGVILIGIWDYEMFRHTRSPLLEKWTNTTQQPTSQEERG